MSSERDRRVAAFGHGALAALHGLGVLWHLRSKSSRGRSMAAFHGAALVVDLISAHRHLDE